MARPSSRRSSLTSLRSDAKTTTQNGHAVCSSQKAMKWTPLAPAFTCETLPVTHLVSPTCLLASRTGGGQSEANSRVQSGMASATPRRAGLRGAGSPLRLRSTPALGGCAHLHASELPQVTILRGEHTARALGREKSKRLPGMKPAHRQSTDALRFGPAPRR